MWDATVYSPSRLSEAALVEEQEEAWFPCFFFVDVGF